MLISTFISNESPVSFHSISIRSKQNYERECIECMK